MILKYRGFTLAEVLITLGIIGVVAAITLPTLIANYKERVFVEAAKKNYSVLTNAMNRWNVENGTIGVPSAFWQSSTSNNDLVLELAKHLNTVKICPSTKLSECGGRYNILQYKKMNDGKGNTSQENWVSSMPRIVLADGTFVSIERGSTDMDANCERMIWSNEKDENGNFIEDTSSPSGFKGHYSNWNVCGRLAFDTNGLREPNQVGVDVFQIAYYGDGKIGTSNNGWGNINYVLTNNKLIQTEKYTIGKFE